MAFVIFKSRHKKRDFTGWVKVVNEITERILMNEDVDLTTAVILNTIKQDLQCFGAVHMQVDESTHELYMKSYTKIPLIQSALKWVSGDIYNNRYPIRGKTTLLGESVKKKQMLFSKELSDFFYKPPSEEMNLSRKLLKRIQNFLGLKLGIAIPIQVQDRVVGVLFMATKKEEFSEEEQIVLQFYAHLAGIAMDHNMKLQRLQEQYETEKETTSLITHELKTPITIASNTVWKANHYLDSHREDLGRHFEKLKEILKEVESGVERLNFTCNSILNLNEVEQGLSNAHQKLNLRPQLQQVLENAKDQARKKGLNFKSNLRLSKKNLYGPGIQFEQILTILLDNAIKYTQEGEVRVKIYLSSKILLCTVHDTGIGIPRRDKENIFKRFYRVRKIPNKHKGLGIGLYMAKRILDQLGGRIEVKNNPTGQGTEFHVQVPVFEKEASHQ